MDSHHTTKIEMASEENKAKIAKWLGTYGLRKTGSTLHTKPSRQVITRKPKLPFFFSVWGEKMNNLELRHLKNFCWKHGLDEQLIDSTLTYGENSGYLKSLVPNFDREQGGREALKEKGLNLYSILTIRETAKSLLEYDLITKEMHDAIAEYTMAERRSFGLGLY